MFVGVHWFVLAHVLGGALTFGLALNLWRMRHLTGAREWIAFLLAMGVSIWSYGIALVTEDLVLRTVFEVIAVAFVMWAAIAFIGYTMVYTGREHVLRSRIYQGLVLAGGLVMVLAATNPWHELLWRNVRLMRIQGLVAAEYSIEPLLFLIAIGVYIITGIGTTRLAPTATSEGDSLATTALYWAMMPILPLLAGTLWLFDVGPYSQLNFLPISFLPNVVADMYGLFYRDVLDITPGIRRTGRRAAIDDLGTPVITVTDDGRIVDLNAVAADLFDVTAAAVVGEPVSELLGTEVELRDEAQSIDIRLEGERRTYKLTKSPFESKGGEYEGYTIAVQDVTAEIHRKQRLEVLNRILRHNLRNDLNVVKLRAERLAADATDPDTEAELQLIGDVTDELLGLGEKAREAVSVLDLDRRTDVELSPFFSTFVADLRDRYPGASVTVDAPDGTEIETNPHILELVLRSAVENGIEHNDSEVPEVTIRVTSAATDLDTLRIDVCDDGPGIPAHELSVIEDGSETELQHGSGIGLWLIHWGTRLLGGDVAFDVDEAGTTVSIRLPSENGTPPAPVATDD